MKKTLVLLLITLFTCKTSGLFSQTWIGKQNYPFSAGADGGICFSINNKIYAGGGLNSKAFYEYDPGTNIWTPKANIPGVSSSRAFGIGFSLNGKGYVGLGLDGNTPKNDFWEYDPSTNTWTQKLNYPGSARDGLFAFATGTLAYVGAGEDPFTYQQFQNCYSYNPTTNTWTPIANYPTSGIIYPFSFAIGSKGYVSCGQQSVEITSTYEYDPGADTWTPKANYGGSARQAGVSFVLNNMAYCGLGMDYNNFFNSFYKYDPTTDTWTSVGAIPAAGRSFPVAASAGTSGFVGLGWSYVSTSTFYKDWWELSTTTSIPSFEKNGYAIYPNPANDFLFVSLPDQETLQYEIIDVLGSKKLTGKLSQPNAKINIEELEAGCYFIKLNAEQNSSTVKFIKND